MLGASAAMRALDPEPSRLLATVPTFGPVVAVTRNFGARLRCEGVYGAPDIGKHTGIVLGDNIDLRVFPSGFVTAWATDGGTEPASIVVRDAAGRAAHAIVLGERSDRSAFERAVDELALPATANAFDGPVTVPASTGAAASDAPAVDDASVDVAAYRAAYAAMTDTHDFFFVLRRFELAREQGLRLAGRDFARPLRPDAYVALFEDALEHRIPLMLFVASDAMVQIASGALDDLFRDGTNRLCVCGGRNVLALAPDAVARAWAVTKPTSLGDVTSLELYGAAGELIVQVFGERHAGEVERDDWRDAVDALG